MEKIKTYDVIIIGGGPAGLTAGIYASRAKLKTILIEKGLAGGQISVTEKVENYAGFSAGAGQELIDIMEKQAREFGTEIVMGEVQEVRLAGETKIVTTNRGEYQAPVVILAMGSHSRKLHVPGEEEFMGRGVSFCATCDGPFYEGLPVMVVGGGDAAVEEGLALTRFAQKVYIVHRRDALRATGIVQERAFAHEKIEFVWDSVVEKLEGEGQLEKAVVRNVKDGRKRGIDINGIFIYIGFIPNTGFVAGEVELDDRGYIITNDVMETSAPGVYAAGDCRRKLLRQAVTAAGDGATAAFAAEKYLESRN